MPFPVTCPACGKSFSISDDVFEQKIKGRVVSVKCKQCQGAIRVDGTKISGANAQPAASPPDASAGGPLAPPAPAVPAATPAVASVPKTPPSAVGVTSDKLKAELARNRPKLAEVAVPTATQIAPRTPAVPGVPLPSVAAAAASTLGVQSAPAAIPRPLTAGRPAESAREESTALSPSPPFVGDPAPTPEEEALFAVDSADGDRELTEQQIAQEIARGDLTEDTLVWREGMAEWLEIKKIPELARHVNKRGLSPKAAPVAPSPKQAAPIASSASPKPNPVAPIATGSSPKAAPVATGSSPKAAPVATESSPKAAPVAAGLSPKAAVAAPTATSASPKPAPVAPITASASPKPAPVAPIAASSSPKPAPVVPIAAGSSPNSAPSGSVGIGSSPKPAPMPSIAKDASSDPAFSSAETPASPKPPAVAPAAASPKAPPVLPVLSSAPRGLKIRPRQATIPMGMMPSALMNPKAAAADGDLATTPKPNPIQTSESPTTQLPPDTTPAPERVTPPLPIPRATARGSGLPPLEAKPVSLSAEPPSSQNAGMPDSMQMIDEEPTILRASPFAELEETPAPRPLPASIRHLLEPSAPRERPVPRPPPLKAPATEPAPRGERMAKIDTFRATPEAKRSWFPEEEANAPIAEPPRPKAPGPPPLATAPKLPPGLPPLPVNQGASPPALNVLEGSPPQAFPGSLPGTALQGKPPPLTGGATGPAPDPLLSNPLLSAPFAAALTSSPFSSPAPFQSPQARMPAAPAPVSFDDVPSFRPKRSPWLWVAIAIVIGVAIAAVLFSRKEPQRAAPAASAPLTAEPRTQIPTLAPSPASLERSGESKPTEGRPTEAAASAEPAVRGREGGGFADLFAAGAKQVSGDKPGRKASPNPSAVGPLASPIR